MRYKVRHVPHRNLAASKRSIVVVCGTLAFMLGTTSVGSSFLFDNNTAELTPPNSTILAGFDMPPVEQPLTTRRQPLGKHLPLVISQDKVQTPTAAGTAAASAFVNHIKKTVAPEASAAPAPTTTETNNTPPPATAEPAPAEPAPTTPPPAEEEPQDPPAEEGSYNDTHFAPMSAPAEPTAEL